MFQEMQVGVGGGGDTPEYEYFTATWYGSSSPNAGLTVSTTKKAKALFFNVTSGAYAYIADAVVGKYIENGTEHSATINATDNSFYLSATYGSSNESVRGYIVY